MKKKDLEEGRELLTTLERLEGQLKIFNTFNSKDVLDSISIDLIGTGTTSDVSLKGSLEFLKNVKVSIEEAIRAEIEIIAKKIEDL